jgi:hypothetical protein
MWHRRRAKSVLIRPTWQRYKVTDAPYSVAQICTMTDNRLSSIRRYFTLKWLLDSRLSIDNHCRKVHFRTEEALRLIWFGNYIVHVVRIHWNVVHKQPLKGETRRKDSLVVNTQFTRLANRWSLQRSLYKLLVLINIAEIHPCGLYMLDRTSPSSN